ncbi:DNA gyrase inhibitor YacG [Tropicibacter sp. R16_0]|uniref:DNA gyrase inhibitor YacG n=1 Tax=Tropicibacter sp. R16_0 TaxID=2821102 RepID=UPI001ADB1EC3|nr:DNA gyrase inhibitor YacG [Tropicibacter sp. R16_0]MBO9448897.1 DNA gyrase inhibitor YacG [Tropicibacter sp. R16_0]
MSCPICEADTVPKYRPFCSKRCADLDLAKWLNGSYALPSNDPEDLDVDVTTEEKAPDRPH